MNLETRYNELNKDYGAYELVNIEKLNDLNSVGLLLKHKKSGARVAIISNDDDNKVFSIGFKTPPDSFLYSESGKSDTNVYLESTSSAEEYTPFISLNTTPL